MKQRADYMTDDQKARMGELPRTHENCAFKLGKSVKGQFFEGPSRPGKTAHDKATGAWLSKDERRNRSIAKQEG